MYSRGMTKISLKAAKQKHVHLLSLMYRMTVIVAFEPALMWKNVTFFSKIY